VLHGKLTIRTDVAGGITAGNVVGNGTNTITLTGTQNAINATLANATGLQYLGDSNFNTSGTTETLTITSNDQGNIGSGGALQTQNSVGITVNAVNDSPVLLGAGPSASTLEQTTVLLDTNVSVSDVDLDPLNSGTGSYAGASLTIARNGGANTQDSFGFDTTGASFTVSGGNLQSGGLTFATFTNSAGTLTITFTGSGTAATKPLVNDVIDHIAYTNMSDAPPANVTLNYTFNDGSPGNGQGSGASATSTGSTVVNITAVNDSPVLANVGPSVAATEQIAVLLDTDALISDVDLNPLNGGSGLYTGASLTIARNGGANAQDSFAFNTAGATFTVVGGDLRSGGQTFATFTNSGGTLTINFTSSGTSATSALVNNVLDHIAYTNTSDTPPASVTLNYTFNDASPGNGQGSGAAGTATASTTVNITAVNDTPVFTGLDNAPAFAEDGATVVLDSNATVIDAELAAAGNYSGAILTLARSGAPDASDAFGTSGTLSFSAGNVLVGAVTVGTFTNSGGTLAITFNASASGSLVNSVLQQITYSNSSDTPPASVQVHYTLNDGNSANAQGPGGAAIGSGDITVSVTSHNDAPVNHIPLPQSVTPGVDLVFSTGNGNAITVPDADVGGGNLTVKLEAAASAILTLGSTAGLTIDPAHLDGTNSVWISGTLADITAALEGLKYNNPIAGNNTLQITTSDNGNTGATGGVQQDVDSISISVVSPITLDLDADDSSGATGSDYRTVFTGGAVTVSDLDVAVLSTTPITTATITISAASFVSGEDVLAFVNVPATMGDIAGTFDPGTGVLTLTSATATLAQWDAALASVTYNDTNLVNPSTTNRTVDVVVSDGASSSPVAHTTVSFHALDLDSTTAGFDATASFLEQTAVAIATNATVTGFDNLTSLTATLVSRPDGDLVESLSLSAAAQTAASNAALTFNYTPATGVLLISGAASLAVYQAILDGIQYDNTSDAPNTANRTVDVVVADGVAGSGQTHTVTVGVTALNDAPVLSPAAPSLTGITEDQVANAGQSVASFLGASATDVDTGAAQGVAITATVDGNGHWEYSLNGGGSWSAVGTVDTTGALLLRVTDFLRFVPDAQNGTTGSITYYAWDQTGATAGQQGTKVDVSSRGFDTPFSALSDTASITVSSVNDSPVLTPAAPTLGGITEDDTNDGGQLVSAVLAASVADVDSIAAQGIAITGTVNGNGHWEYSQNGTTWTPFGAVNGASSLLLAASDHIRFVPDAQNGTSASFTYRAWDQTAGASGGTADTTTNGGTTPYSTATDTASISVASANDAPTAAADIGSAAENEIKSFNVLTNDTDVDIGDTKTLASIDGVTVTSANGTINGIIATGDLSIVAGQIQFSPGTQFDALAAGQTASVVVDYTMHDSQNASSSSSLTLTVTGVNDAPVLASVATSAAYPPGAGPVVLAPALTISDIDSATFAGATIRINSATTFLGDVLAANGQTNGVVPGFAAITAVYNPGNATLTLTGVDTVAHYEALLRLITFQSLSATPTNGGANAARSVEWQVNDGSGANNLSNIPTTDIRLHTLDLDANDSTALSTSYATTFTEHGTGVFIAGDSASDITISDVDLTGGQKLTSATVTLTNAKAGDSLSVLGALAGGITSAIDASVAGQITLTLSGGSATGAASIADYQTALHQIQFASSSSNPDTTQRVISVVVRDSLNIDTNAAISTVSIIPVNDAPVVNSGAASLAYIENQVPTAIDPGLDLTDPDSINLVGATISITANFHSGQDILGFVNRNGITGSYNAAAGILTLIGVASVATYEAALQSVTYFNASDAPSGDVRTIGFTVDDGSPQNHASNVGIATVTVFPVNDAPVLNGVPAVAAYANGPAVILAPGLMISDLDSSTLTSATVHVGAGAFAGHGDVLAISATDLAGTSIVANYNAATETLTLTGTDTLAHYSQALEHITFQTTNFGTDRAQTIEWQVSDGAASNNLSTLAITTISLPRPPANDFNGNGHSDILWQFLDGTPAVWTVDGTSLVSGSNVGFNPGSDWHEIGSGDFNGDGKSDILWQNNNGTIAEWFMDGASLISGGSVAFNPGTSWHAIGTGDFNGDGKSDILWQNADGTPAVWLMDGLNILSGANVGFNPGPAWHVIGAGDFDGDGKSDILWQNADGTPAVWLMNGTNLLSGSNVGFNPGSAWHAVSAGDFNGDGKADILWQNNDGTPAVWLMNGASLISGTNVGFNPGPAWHALNTGDYNADGKADILWQNNDGTPAVWLMDGTSLISGANVGFNPGSNWHVIPHHDGLFG
jgi:hypothetical protein